MSLSGGSRAPDGISCLFCRKPDGIKPLHSVIFPASLDDGLKTVDTVIFNIPSIYSVPICKSPNYYIFIILYIIYYIFRSSRAPYRTVHTVK